MNRSTNRSGHTHASNGSRRAGHQPDAHVSYELTGAVRWLDLELQRIVLHVDEAGAHGGQFVGSDLTVDLAEAHVHGAELSGLTPGARARVKLRLAPDLGLAVPALVTARTVYALST